PSPPNASRRSLAAKENTSTTLLPPSSPARARRSSAWRGRWQEGKHERTDLPQGGSSRLGRRQVHRAVRRCQTPLAAHPDGATDQLCPRPHDHGHRNPCRSVAKGFRGGFRKGFQSLPGTLGNGSDRACSEVPGPPRSQCAPLQPTRQPECPAGLVPHLEEGAGEPSQVRPYL